MQLTTALPVGTVLLGFLLGMQHATDADHVVAVTTIMSRERGFLAASRVGAVWGLGHTVTVLIVGSAIIVFRVAIPVRLGLAMEFAVAVVLILLGGASLGARLRRPVSAGREESRAGDIQPLVHTHAHYHGNVRHRHPHVHPHLNQHETLPDEGTDRPHSEHHMRFLSGTPSGSRRRLIRSFGVGLVHGMAGSAAIALLVLSTIPSPALAILYLLVFCAGVIVGMTLITAAIAAPFVFTAGRLSWLHESFVAASGVTSLGFGLVLGYQIGIVDQLFGAAPLWIPR